MSSVPCNNSIRSEDSLGIALEDILPWIRSTWVDDLPRAAELPVAPSPAQSPHPKSS
jgi:hypothetical protein